MLGEKTVILNIIALQRKMKTFPLSGFFLKTTFHPLISNLFINSSMGVVQPGDSSSSAFIFAYAPESRPEKGNTSLLSISSFRVLFFTFCFFFYILFWYSSIRNNYFILTSICEHGCGFDTLKRCTVSATFFKTFFTIVSSAGSLPTTSLMTLFPKLSLPDSSLP